MASVIEAARGLFGYAPAGIAMAAPGLADLMWRQALKLAEQKRLDHINAAWDMYQGDLKEPLVVKSGSPNDNVMINYGRVVVDKGVSFLFGREPGFELSEGETTPAEAWLTEVWRRNRKNLLLKKAAMNGAVCGHVFIKIVMASPYPRLINLPPEYVAVDTDTDDIDQVYRYIIQYGAEGRNGEQLVKRQVVERTDAGRWQIVDEVSQDGRSFEMVQSLLWPWDWPPIVDCQNLPAANDYYGTPDLTPDAMHLIGAYNFVRSNTQRIIRYHAHPKTIGSGFQPGELKGGADGTIILPSAEAKLYTIEMMSDLNGSLQQARELEDAILQLTRTPPVALAKVDGLGQLSGVALQILYGPIKEKTDDKRETYGEMLVELNRRLLEMGGYGAENLTTIRWQSSVPESRLEAMQVAIMAEQIGVSRDTVLSELGYDAVQEKEKKADEVADLGDQLLGQFDRGAVADDEDEDAKRA